MCRRTSTNFDANVRKTPVGSVRTSVAGRSGRSRADRGRVLRVVYPMDCLPAVCASTDRPVSRADKSPLESILTTLGGNVARSDAWRYSIEWPDVLMTFVDSTKPLVQGRPTRVWRSRRRWVVGMGCISYTDSLAGEQARMYATGGLNNRSTGRLRPILGIFVDRGARRGFLRPRRTIGEQQEVW
jgi:hypothetical protein